MSASVSFDPLGLILLPALFLIGVNWPKRHGDTIETSRVGLLRRFAAFYIDLFIAMAGVLPIICMTALATEFYATGNWQWSYERDFFRPTDVIDIAAFLLGFAGIFYYFRWHFKKRVQTLGQHVLGFTLIATDANPSMTTRAFVALVILSWWPFWPWTMFGHKQDFLWDTASRIKARRVYR
jgi:hypothetical protein